MEETYVVYCEEYYFNCNYLKTILKKKVYNVSYEEKSAEEVLSLIEEVNERIKEKHELNANNEILVSYSCKIIKLEGHKSIEEATNAVINDDYTWGKVGSQKM